MTSIDAAHAALLRVSSLQFEFPQGQDPKPDPPPQFHFGSGGVDTVWIVVIGLALVVVLLASRAMINRMPSAARDAAPLPPIFETIVPRSVAEAALADADALAARGDFLEAVHVLLGCGVNAITRRYPDLLRPTDTSREIAASPKLPTGIRDAFAPIAAVVERGLFARRPIGQGDYAGCRQVFVASALAERAAF